jgi:hypothetical protein
VAEKAARYLDLEPHEDVGKQMTAERVALTNASSLSNLRSRANTSCSSKFLQPPSTAPGHRALDRSISIAYDSRRVGKNSLFVALTGERTDGHQFIDRDR